MSNFSIILLDRASDVSGPVAIIVGISSSISKISSLITLTLEKLFMVSSIYLENVTLSTARAPPA